MGPDVLQYIDALPENRRERSASIHDPVLGLYPEAWLDMRYSMPTYTVPGGDRVALANRKQYISLYTCSTTLIACYLEKHPEQKAGKGCINFRDRDQIHLQDLIDVIRHAIEASKA